MRFEGNQTIESLPRTRSTCKLVSIYMTVDSPRTTFISRAFEIINVIGLVRGTCKFVNLHNCHSANVTPECQIGVPHQR